MRLAFALLSAVLNCISVNAVSSPPSGSITIGPSGSGAKYTSLTSALADTSSNVYFVYSGTYSGQHYVNRADITIYGQSTNSLAYSSNTVTFSNARNSSEAGSNDAGATIRIASSANNVKLYNLNIANTWGAGVQAVALSVQSTGNFACYACQLKGYQDTLLSNQGYQFYGKTYIEGAVDFIFGQRASVWFYGSTIKTLGSGYITASGRDSNDSAWYVIDHSTVTGTGTQYLGRPWRSWARVVFQYTSLPSTIPAAGWSQWSSATPNIDNIYYGEYNNTGAGAWRSGRASFATLMTSPIGIATVLGSTSWIDQAYLTGGTSTSSTTTSTSSSTSTTATTTTTTSSGGGGCAAAQWAQCGGSGYTGCTLCVAGTTCTYSNEWYSQCL